MHLFRSPPATDKRDWEALYRQCYPQIYNYFRFRISDEAEDLTAITFERAWRHRHRYDHDRGEFQAWLFGIARNVAAHHLRQHKPVIALEEAQEWTNVHDPPLDQIVQTRANMAQLATLLKALPERERDLIALKYGMELTNREIAQQTGLSESNVGTILYRTVRKLRAEWDITS